MYFICVIAVSEKQFPRPRPLGLDRGVDFGSVVFAAGRVHALDEGRVGKGAVQNQLITGSSERASKKNLMLRLAIDEVVHHD
jgi:hypothetical protein